MNSNPTVAAEQANWKRAENRTLGYHPPLRNQRCLHKHMRVIILGTYPNDRQESMLRYARMLHSALQAEVPDVSLIAPASFIGALQPSRHGLGKWLGYIDKFAIFPFHLLWRLLRDTRESTIVHIIDQSCAVYAPLVGSNCLVTCHDLLAIRAASGEFPDVKISRTGKMYQGWIRWSLRRCSMICAVSRSTRDDAIRVLNRSGDTIPLVPNPLNYPFLPLPAHVAADAIGDLLAEKELARVRKKIDGNGYILHLGGNGWYKNRLGVLRIFRNCLNARPKDSPILFMAGGPATNELREYVRRYELTEDVFFLGSVGDAQLNALYSKARALLFPSNEEGFGWPIIEAQAAGCRVITTNHPPMNEVGGRSVALVPRAPTTIDDELLESWAAKCANIVWRVLDEPPEQRSSFIDEGLRHASTCKVDAMISYYLGCYQSQLSRNHARVL